MGSQVSTKGIPGTVHLFRLSMMILSPSFSLLSHCCNLPSRRIIDGERNGESIQFLFSLFSKKKTHTKNYYDITRGFAVAIRTFFLCLQEGTSTTTTYSSLGGLMAHSTSTFTTFPSLLVFPQSNKKTFQL